MASFGFNTSICSISFFFFSPPENPTFKLLSILFEFIFNSSIYPFNSCLNLNIFTGSPVTLFLAYFKKLVTDTPGISSGNWNDINTPFLAISSVFEFVISVPSNLIVPFVFVYAGLFKIAFAVVVFPEPFGPIITCISPLFMFKFIPFRISFSSAFTHKSFISIKVSFILKSFLFNVL